MVLQIESNDYIDCEMLYNDVLKIKGTIEALEEEMK